eukprot:575343_1
MTSFRFVLIVICCMYKAYAVPSSSPSANPLSSIGVVYRGHVTSPITLFGFREDLILSQNGYTQLKMQSDGNLVLYHRDDNTTAFGGASWSSNTHAGGSNCYLTLHNSGDLILYDANNMILWHSNHSNSKTGIAPFVLSVSDDGTASISDNTQTIMWGTRWMPIHEYITSPYTLYGQYSETIRSTNNLVELRIQPDGNLVLYNMDGGEHVLWAANTGSFVQLYTTVLHDSGDLVTYYQDNSVFWNSSSETGIAPFYLVVSNAFVAYIVDSNNAIVWTTEGSPSGPYPTRIFTLAPSIIHPSSDPSTTPSLYPTNVPSVHPTNLPSMPPTNVPSIHPTNVPSVLPTDVPSMRPTSVPSAHPTNLPSIPPTDVPSMRPANVPSIHPSSDPTTGATKQPSKAPLHVPTLSPTFIPSSSPTQPPSLSPTRSSSVPTADPSKSPSKHPVIQPTTAPTKTPPSEYPTATPTSNPIKADAVVTNYEISFEITSCEDQETECQLDEEIIEEVTEVIIATIGEETEDGIVDVISVEIVDDDLVIRLSVMTDPTQALKPGYITSHIEKEVEGNDNLDQLGEVEVEEKDPEFNDIVRKNAHPSVMQYIHTLISNPLYLGAALLALLICCCVICIFVIYNNIRKQRTKQIQLVNMSSMSTDDALGTPGMHAPLSGTGTAGTPGDALDGRIAGMDTTITTGLGQSPYVQNSAFMPLDAMSLSAGAMPLDTRMAAMSLSAGAMSMSPMGGVTATGHTNTDTIDRFGELADLPFETKDVTLGTEDVLMNGGDMDPDTDTDGEDEDMYVNDDKRASYMMTPGGTPGGDLLGGIECEEEEKQTTAQVDQFMNDPQLQMEGGFGTLGPPPPPPLHSGEDANNTGYVMSDDAHATKGGLTD